MVPSLLMIRVGERGRIPIALPVFLLWPLLALGALVVGLGTLGTSRASALGRRMRAGWLAIQAVGQLRGLKIDVSEKDGQRVFIWFL